MKLGVIGAGAIGTYVGGRLAAAGEDVALVGRLGAELANGLTLSDLRGGRHIVAKDELRYSDRADSLSGCDVVFVAVKSLATEDAAKDLAPVLRPDACVVSLQNGVANAPALRRRLPSHLVLEGMVTFNVVRPEPGRFHLATGGPILIARAPIAVAIEAALARAGLDVALDDDMVSVLWSKLLFNLNNPVNALSGVTLRDELGQRGYRRVLAASMREGLAVLAAAGIRPRRLGALAPRLAPFALELPDFLFRVVARGMLEVDPQARSSMSEDLERRRPTEIDFLNGALVELGEKHGVATPVNRRIRELVHAAEREGKGSPRLAAAELLARASGP